MASKINFNRSAKLLCLLQTEKQIKQSSVSFTNRNNEDSQPGKISSISFPKNFFKIYFYQNIYFQHYSPWKCDSVFANILQLIWWKLISPKLVGTSLCRIQSVYRCKVTPANTVHCHQQMLSNSKEKYQPRWELLLILCWQIFEQTINEGGF